MTPTGDICSFSNETDSNRLLLFTVRPPVVMREGKSTLLGGDKFLEGVVSQSKLVGILEHRHLNGCEVCKIQTLRGLQIRERDLESGGIEHDDFHCWLR